jgi:uncharacterized protein YjiS (DUF1127 family)
MRCGRCGHCAMMNAIPNDESPTVTMALDQVIRAHGVLAVLWALTWRLLRPPPRMPNVAGMNAHLLRDIGLPPDDVAPWHPPLR